MIFVSSAILKYIFTFLTSVNHIQNLFFILLGVGSPVFHDKVLPSVGSELWSFCQLSTLHFLLHILANKTLYCENKFKKFSTNIRALNQNFIIIPLRDWAIFS